MKIRLQNALTNNSLEKQPHETVQSSILKNNKFSTEAFKVTISEEGLGKYRELAQQMGGSVNGKIESTDGYCELMSKSVLGISGIIQSEFQKRFVQSNNDTKRKTGDCDFSTMQDNCYNVYTEMRDEIKRAYAEGTRDLWVCVRTVGSGTAECETLESAFRKITEQEELEALDASYKFFTDVVQAHKEFCDKFDVKEIVYKTQQEFERQKALNKERALKEEEKEKDEIVLEKVNNRLMKSAEQREENNLLEINNTAFTNQILMDDLLLDGLKKLI